MSMENILDTLTENLMKNEGVSREKISSLSKLELAFLLMEKYIKYPAPSLKETLLPFNYCALSLLYPWVNPLLSLVC